jgi:hypothetical protein
MWHECPGLRKLHPRYIYYLLYEENPMKCPICKHGETENGYATVALERNKTTLILNIFKRIFVTIVAKNKLTKAFRLSFLTW